MQAVIQKWGNSLGLRIPSIFARDFSLKSGSPVEIKQEKDRIVIIPKKITLEEMMMAVTPENIHSEIETGNSMGNEEW